MSVFGDDEEGFNLPSGSDEARPKAAPKRPGASAPAPRQTAPVPSASRPTSAARRAPTLPRVPRKATPPVSPAQSQLAPVEEPAAQEPAEKPFVPRVSDAPPISTLPSRPHPTPVTPHYAPEETFPMETLPEVDGYDEGVNLAPSVSSGPADQYSESIAYEAKDSFGHIDSENFEDTSAHRSEATMSYGSDERDFQEPVRRTQRRSTSYDPDEFDEPRVRSRRVAQPVDDEDDYGEDYDEQEDDDEPVVRRAPKKPSRQTPKSSSRGKSQSSKNSPVRKKGKKKQKGSEGEEESRYFGGGRKRVLITNIVAGTFIVGILGFGLNSILNPPYIPTQDDMSGLVSEELNITGFDKDGGNAIVTAFVKEYFTFTDDGGTGRSDRLAPYMNDAALSTISSSSTSVTGATQSVSGEPRVTGVEATDAHNAVYNVAVKVGSKWLYVDVPVFYNEADLSYTISGVPSFTPPPKIATPGESLVEEFDGDIEIQGQTEANIASFFKAWGSSDGEALGRYITGDADEETRGGLQGTVIFSELSSYTVESKDPADPTADTRRAIAVVEWANSTSNANLSYTQNFELELYRQPDDRWYVADIKPAENTYAPSDAVEEAEETTEEE